MTVADKFTVYVIHHSHTDVGYTDTQEKMKMHHIGFIKEVVDILESGRTDFKWTCEGFWAVEQFLSVADEHYKNAFIKHVKNGSICISGNYLNLTEIVSARVLNETMERMVAELTRLGLKAKSAMTADINGYSWGYADTLIESGITGLMSNIHTHHGYHPLLRKQNAFYWISPKGEKLLVWNGEHYLLGNEMGIAEASEFEYTIQDGLSYAKMESFDKSVARLNAYVKRVKSEGYEYDFIPLNVSGNMTDNSPPSLKVCDFIECFNKQSDSLQLKLVTLDEFFDVVRAQKNIPSYSGDWTDWWADGVASTPSDLMFYREASRKFDIARKLDATNKIVGGDTMQNALYNLMFYSEHTWGYSSSITEPYHPQVNNLDQWKRLYALKANEAATVAIMKIASYYGETQISLHKDLSFTAVNPHDIAVKDMLVIDLEHFYGYNNFDVVDSINGKKVPFQLSRYSRGPQMCIEVRLEAKEVKRYKLVEREKPQIVAPPLCAEAGIEGINDLNHIYERDVRASGAAGYDCLENNWVKVSYEIGKGITSIFDKVRKVELMRKSEYLAFQPIYEVTPLDGNDYLWVRRNMGRNRKMPRTERSVGKLCDLKFIENGALFTRIELVYKIEGCEKCSVILTVMKNFERIYADLRLHKKSEWKPENLYLALPFTSGDNAEQMYIDKTNAVLRPRVDQLKGTCTDFYSVQNGMAYIGKKNSVIVAAQDAPLIWMGRLDCHQIKLAGENGVGNIADTFSWVMNNFWETNFKASLGGFYQFRYSLSVSDKTAPSEVFCEAESINESTLNFYSFNEK